MSYNFLDKTGLEYFWNKIKAKIPTKTSDLTNDSGYTTNTGTVTSVSVKMNNATKGTVTTSGTIDLGTVITAHQDISGKQDKLTTQTAYTSKGSATKVPQITTNNLGQVTGITEVTITQPTVNNGTLNIQKNGTNVGTFTANQSGNSTANLTFSRNELSIIASKEYSGLYGTANDQPGASFYYASIRPTNFYDVWRVKIRVYANVPNQNNYKQFSEVEIYGCQDNFSYASFNRLYSTSYATYYYHNLYRLTSTGYNAGYSHTLGIGLRNATNPTSSSYPRTVKIEVLETENCTFTFLDSAINITEVSGYGSTNFAGVSEMNGRDNGLQETGDATVIHQLRHNNGNYVTTTALGRYVICFTKDENKLVPSTAVNNSTATTKALTTDEFDPYGNIMYYNSTTALSANGSVTGSTLYYQVNLDLRYSFNTGTTLTNNKAVYLKCVPQNNGKVKLDSTPIVQTLPSTADGKIYIYLGMASSTYQIELNYSHPIYEYKENALRLYKGPSEEIYTSTEKTKLSGIATGATNVTTTTVSGWGYTKNTGTITGVSVNGTSIATSGVANLVTNTAYNASTNKIATMADISGGLTFDDVYPVGSIYMSVNSTNPSTLFGGTWQKLKDTFLLGAGDTYVGGSTGGEASHTLTVDEIPSHTHTYDRTTGNNANNFNRTFNNTAVASVTITSTDSGSTGGGQAHNNMPPYLVVYMWKRTA